MSCFLLDCNVCMRTPLDILLISGNLVLNSKYANDISFGLINKNLLKDNFFLLFEISYFLREKKVKYSAKLQISWFLIEVGMRSKDSCFISVGWCCDKGSILIGADKKFNKTCIDVSKLTSIKSNILKDNKASRLKVMNNKLDESYEISSVCSVVSSSMEYQRGAQNYKNFSDKKLHIQKFNFNDVPFAMSSCYIQFNKIFESLNAKKQLIPILKNLWEINNTISSEYLSYLRYQNDLNGIKSDAEQIKLLSKVNNKFNLSQIKYYEPTYIEKTPLKAVNQEFFIKKYDEKKNYLSQLDKSTNEKSINLLCDKYEKSNFFCAYGSSIIPYYEGVEAEIKPAYIISKIHLLCSYIYKLKLDEYKNFDSQDDFAYNLYSFNLFEFFKNVSLKDMSLSKFFSYKTPQEALKEFGVEILMEKIISGLNMYSENELNEFKKNLNEESYPLMEKIISFNIGYKKKVFPLKKEIKKFKESDQLTFIMNIFELMKTIVNEEVNFFQLLCKDGVTKVLKRFKSSIIIDSIKTYLNNDNSLAAQKWKNNIKNLRSEEDRVKFIQDILQKYKDLSVLYVLLKIQNNEGQVIKFSSSDLSKIEADLDAKKYNLISVFNEYLNVPNLFDLFSDPTQKKLLNDLNFYYSAYKMFKNETNLLSNFTNFNNDKKKLSDCAKFGFREISYISGQNNLPSILNRNLSSDAYNTLIFQKENLAKYNEAELDKRFNSLFIKDKEKGKVVKRDIIDFDIEEFIFNFIDKENTFEKHKEILVPTSESYLAQVAFSNIYIECVSKLEDNKKCFESLINYPHQNSFKQNESIREIEKKLHFMKSLAGECIDKLNNEGKRQVNFYKNTALGIGLRGYISLLKETINILNINSHFLDLLKNSNDCNKSKIYIAMILNNLIYANIGDFASDYPFLIEEKKERFKKSRLNNLDADLKIIDKIFISCFIHYTKNNSDFSKENDFYYDFFKNIDSIKYTDALDKNEQLVLQSILQQALLNYDLSKKLNYLYSLSFEYIKNNHLFKKRKKEKYNERDRKKFKSHINNLIHRIKNTINEIKPYISVSNLPTYLSSNKHND